MGVFIKKFAFLFLSSLVTIFAAHAENPVIEVKKGQTFPVCTKGKDLHKANAMLASALATNSLGNIIWEVDESGPYKAYYVESPFHFSLPRVSELSDGNAVCVLVTKD